MVFFVLFDFCCQSFIMKTLYWAMSLPRFEIFHCQKICFLKKSRTKSYFLSTHNLSQASHRPRQNSFQESPLVTKTTKHVCNPYLYFTMIKGKFFKFMVFGLQENPFASHKIESYNFTHVCLGKILQVLIITPKSAPHKQKVGEETQNI